MTAGVQMSSAQDRFQHLLRVISSERFLKMQSLGNEVPFYICPYPAKEAVEMGNTVKQLARRLEGNGLRILEINLYDLSIALLKQRGIWARILEIEPTVSKEQLKELLQGVLDPETGRRYRREILEAGGSRPAIESFRAFRGREPSIDALMRHQGMA